MAAVQEYNVMGEFLRAFQGVETANKKKQAGFLEEAHGKEREFADLTQLSHALIQARAEGKEKLDLTHMCDLIDRIRSTDSHRVLFSGYKVGSAKELNAQIDLIQNDHSRLSQTFQNCFLQVNQSLKELSEILDAAKSTMDRHGKLLERMIGRAQ